MASPPGGIGGASQAHGPAASHPPAQTSPCLFTYVREKHPPKKQRSHCKTPVNIMTRIAGSASIRSGSRVTKASQAPYAAVAVADPSPPRAAAMAPGGPESRDPFFVLVYKRAGCRGRFRVADV